MLLGVVFAVSIGSCARTIAVASTVVGEVDVHAILKQPFPHILYNSIKRSFELRKKVQIRPSLYHG